MYNDISFLIETDLNILVLSQEMEICSTECVLITNILFFLIDNLNLDINSRN